MDRVTKMVGILGLALVAVGAAACSTNTTTNVAGAQQQTGVTVSGYGEVKIVPDTGHMVVGVEARAKTVAEARTTAASAAEKVLASVKANRIDAKDIQTAAINVMPQYDYQNNTQTLTGYIVSNTVTVRVRPLDSFSKVIDDALAAGGDNARLHGIRFEVDDDAKPLAEARESAMKDARTKAEQLARAGGVSLGKPLAISETQSNGVQYQALLGDFAGKAAFAQGGSSTPVEAGSNAVVVTVIVTYSLGD